MRGKRWDLYDRRLRESAYIYFYVEVNANEGGQVGWP